MPLLVYLLAMLEQSQAVNENGETPLEKLPFSPPSPHLRTAVIRMPTLVKLNIKLTKQPLRTAEA